ncbi:hypothetical protein W97_08883 [Coniosporium apollinis CBS 100218]|uniref:Glyoxalase/fosfomycin resistance/dioxygenase domain-containing protein n=1 Tax=Coniosporium apollinis (strain CBS 100218) TaxID=1168221 RepID=R7Z6A5_CONA1|nr:uncharacterized protein W97_08883 [Coniosporium apollinis CBS 100218]EON69623.1 hypothetical protein W97_08883 [Coniosporium apollinis CBS 100218]
MSTDTASTTSPTPAASLPNYTPPSPNSICFTTIPVHSLPRAQTFYTTVFAWTFRPTLPPSSTTTTSPLPTLAVFHTAGDVMGALSVVAEDVKIGEDDSSKGMVNYILVDDVDATLMRVEEAGGTVEREKWVEGGHTELGLWRDTEGNLGGVLRWVMR